LNLELEHAKNSDNRAGMLEQWNVELETEYPFNAFQHRNNLYPQSNVLNTFFHLSIIPLFLPSILQAWPTIPDPA